MNRSRGRIRRAAALGAVLLVVTLGTAVPPAVAQSTPAVSLESVTPWVDADGTWTVEFDTTGLPLDGFVRLSVRQRLRGDEETIRERLRRQARGESLGSQVAAPRAVRTLEVIDPAGVVRLDVPLQSSTTGSGGIRLSDRGLYPVEITFEDASGTVLASRVVHLVHVGDDPPPPLLVSVLTPVRSGPVLAPDGVLDAAEAATAAERQLDLADAAGDLAVTVDLDPEVLEGLARSERPDDSDLLARLTGHLRTRRVLRRPWAPVDLEGWARAGRPRVVREGLEAGQEVVAERAGQLVDPRGWAPDPTLGPEGLRVLADLGTTYVVSHEDRLQAADPPTGEVGTSRPVRISGSGTALDGLVLDEEIASWLTDGAGTGAGAVESAHGALVRMLAGWFDTDGLRRGSVVELGSTVDLATARALLELLRTPPPGSGPAVTVTEPEILLDELRPITVRRAGRDQPWTRALREPDGEAPAVVLREAGDRAGRLRTRTAAAASMLPTGDPTVEQATLALRQFVHRDLTEADRDRLLDLATSTTDRVLGAIGTPERRTVTVTARDATIPLRLTNRHDQPLRVRLRFESPRLQFRDGETQDLTLQPGINRIEVPVSVRSSGEFLLRTSVESPAVGTVLARATVRVRSTTFSGVGLILSGGALLVLVVWWGRTIRRNGAERGRRREGSTGATTPAG